MGPGERHLRRRLAIAALLVGLPACASFSERPDALLDAWVGRSASELREAWGLPSDSYPAPDWQFHVYRSSFPRSWGWLNAGALSCEITFGLYRGRVSLTHWSGEAWICTRMAREREAH